MKISNMSWYHNIILLLSFYSLMWSIEVQALVSYCVKDFKIIIYSLICKPLNNKFTRIQSEIQLRLFIVWSLFCTYWVCEYNYNWTWRIKTLTNTKIYGFLILPFINNSNFLNLQYRVTERFATFGVFLRCICKTPT